MRARPALPVLLAIAAVAAVGALVGAQPPAPPGVRQEALRLLGDLARLRGLPAPASPPSIVVQTREERRRYVAGELARKLPPARLEAERRALVAWGALPPDFDVAGFLADLLAEQAAAYYDPALKVLALANWLTPDLRRDALAHELVHFLQDRQVGIERFLASPPGRSDGALARRALVEGEAVALALELRLRREGTALARLPDVLAHQQAIAASATGPVLERAPRFLRAMLTFPYAEGLGFVHQFRRRRPWSALASLYADPPRASAQILHPERYLDRREDPRPLVLPDLAPVLGPAARLVVEDELGEFALREVLRQALGEDARADAWAGDRYALWEAPGSPGLLLARLAAPSETGAAAVARDLERWMSRRHGPSVPGPPEGLAVWTPGPGASVIERRGTLVLLLDGVPPVLLDAVRAAAWAAGHPEAPGASGRGS